MRPVPRMQLGNYEALLQLATGGMATVYVARQIGAGGFERLVVVKRVHPHLLANREFSDMFRDEARVAAMLHHPNVVAVTDVVESDGELFLVMEYIDSVAVSTLLKAAVDLEQRLPTSVVARVMVDALSGLHAAHEAIDMRGNRLEIVHRDVSPQNVIVGVDGTSRLIDFGVAKAEHRLTETRSGSVKGKSGYMSPEQARGQPIDRRADLFSAGIVLWEALCGARLFRGETDFETFHRIVEGPIPPPSSRAPSVTPRLDAVVLKALARDPAARFQTAAEFTEALEGACPHAPPREVAAIVKAYCGERVDGRRATLQGILEGRIAPLTAARVAAGPGGEAESAAGSGALRRQAEARSQEGTESQIAAARDAPVPRLASRRTLVWAALGATLVGAVALWVPRGRVATPALVTTAGSAPVGSTGVRPDEVVIHLTADTPIDRVSAPGIHDAEVEGASARLVVARWGGDLLIEAVLEGGATARALAQLDGPRDIHLVTAAAVPGSASAPPPVASKEPRSAVRPAPPAPAPLRPPPAGPAQGDLHANPYGP